MPEQCDLLPPVQALRLDGCESVTPEDEINKPPRINPYPPGSFRSVVCASRHKNPLRRTRPLWHTKARHQLLDKVVGEGMDQMILEYSRWQNGLSQQDLLSPGLEDLNIVRTYIEIIRQYA